MYSNKEIQFAKIEDVVQITAFAYKTFNENKLEDLGSICEVDFDKLLAGITEMVVDEVVLVKRNQDNNKLLDGVLLLKTTDLWWSTNKVLSSGLFYIEPHSRSFKAALAFLNAAKEYGIMVGLPVVFDLFTQKDSERKKKLLRYTGFKEVGSLYIFSPHETATLDTDV